MSAEDKKNPEIEVWCKDCDRIIYDAIVADLVTQNVADNTAVEHAYDLGHEVIIYDSTRVERVQ